MAYESEAAKTDQIAHRLFTKFALVVDNARNVQYDVREDGKIEKWVRCAYRAGLRVVLTSQTVQSGDS